MYRDREQIEKEYERWLSGAFGDKETETLLMAMGEDEKADAFFRDMEFGTGGLRGVLGAGTNRMNIFTVARASAGLASYIHHHFSCDHKIAAVSYDSRLKSQTFARITAAVLAESGIKVRMYRDLMPTPMLSWAVRRLGCCCGVMITASHNPAKYNGYKVYGADGGQITEKAAKDILGEIEKRDYFSEGPVPGFQDYMESGMISYIEGQVEASFFQEIQSRCYFGKSLSEGRKNLSVVYTPLNGTGLKPVLSVLQKAGYEKLFVVPEQERPDGKFPTCPSPNPETPKAMELGIRYAVSRDADIVLATDPDCDRVGAAVKDGNGSYELLTANETGLLLLDFICQERLRAGTMPARPIFIKSLVTARLAERVALHYGVEVRNVPTGFKYIGEQIGRLEREGRGGDFIFGFEESYGYLNGDYVRDKDGVGACCLICEMASYYKEQGRGLVSVLEELYETHGYCLEALHTYQFEGPEGSRRMAEIMADLRAQNLDSIAGLKINSAVDYLVRKDGTKAGAGEKPADFPSSNMLRIELEGDSVLIIRPSGTEPKIKAYLSVGARRREQARQTEQRLARYLKDRFR